MRFLPAGDSRSELCKNCCELLNKWSDANDKKNNTLDKLRNLNDSNFWSVMAAYTKKHMLMQNPLEIP